MRTNYMMTVDDVMEELGVKRSKASEKIEKIRVKRMKREKFKHLLKTLGLSAGRK